MDPNTKRNLFALGVIFAGLFIAGCAVLNFTTNPSIPGFISSAIAFLFGCLFIIVAYAMRS